MKYKEVKDFLRAVFYARVSTDEEEQLNSIELQIEENRNVIREKGWTLVDEYVDRGKTGTVVKGRDEYKRLYEDMLSDKFDIIVIKDQDRLMRNTRDWYLFVDRLVQTNKKLYLYLDGKFFSPGEDALLSGIKAIIAEEFSRNLSKKLHNFNDRRVEKARSGDTSIMLQGSNAYGWTKRGGRYEVNPEQFKVRRYACELLMQDKGANEIAKILNDAGYRNSQGREWRRTDIPKLVYDEKNIGVMILNKERRDFEGKRRVQMPPEEWVRLENAFPPVVTMEEWAKIQSIKERRLAKVNGKNRGKKVSTVFSGKLVCGCCGSVMWKRQKNYKGKISHYYACSRKLKFGCATRKQDTVNGHKGEDNPQGCDSVNITDKFLRLLIEAIAERLEANTDTIKASMVNSLTEIKKTILRANTGFTEGDLERERSRKDKLLEAFLDGIISKEEYKAKAEGIEEKIQVIQSDLENRESSLEDVAEIDRVIADIDRELAVYLENNKSLRTDWLIENIESITVYENMIAVSIPVFGKGVIAGKVPLVSGSNSIRIQREQFSLGKIHYWNRDFDMNLSLVA